MDHQELHHQELHHQFLFEGAVMMRSSGIQYIQSKLLNEVCELCQWCGVIGIALGIFPILRVHLGSIILIHGWLPFPKYFGVPNFETYPNNPSIIGKWPLDSPENQKSSKSTSVGRGPSKLATFMPQSSLHPKQPSNQMLQLVIWVIWIVCYPQILQHSLWTKPSYNSEAKSNLRQPLKKKRQQPSHHHGSTPALHWQRQWQHSCRAYPTWSVPFPAEKPGIFLQGFRPGSLKLSSFAHQLRHDGIWGVLIQCLVEFSGWSWHYLSTKASPPGHLAP